MKWDVYIQEQYISDEEYKRIVMGRDTINTCCQAIQFLLYEIQPGSQVDEASLYSSGGLYLDKKGFDHGRYGTLLRTTVRL